MDGRKKRLEEEFQLLQLPSSAIQNMSGNFGPASNHLWQQEQYFQFHLM
jgi:hypothetical protein